MAVADVPIEVVIGNTESLAFECLEDGDVVTGGWTGSTLVFRAVKLGGSELIRKVVPHDGTVATLDLSVVETRAVPRGELARYELERRISGEQKTLFAGRLIGKLGDNDDD